MNVQPWQWKVLEKMTKYKGRGIVQITGRSNGKSTVTAQYLQRLMDDLNSHPIEELVLGEGTVYGARYYTVAPIGGNWLEMETWCLDTYGRGDYPIWGEKQAPEPQQRWYANARKFWFRNESDRTMFILKWS